MLSSITNKLKTLIGQSPTNTGSSPKVEGKSISKVKSTAATVFSTREGQFQDGIKSNSSTKLSQDLGELNMTSNSRYDPETVCKRLIAKYKDPDQILKAINNLKKSDPRFNTQDANFQVDENALKKIISQLNNAAKQMGRAKSDAKTKEINKFPNDNNKPRKKVSPKKMAKFERKIASEIVGCVVIRQPLIINSDKLKVCQQHGHMKETNRQLTFEKGHSISAELQKTESNVTEIANHAVITMGNEDDSRVICTRSSRTDNPDKIRKKSQADILARLETSSKDGLKPVYKNGKDGEIAYYETQRSDITLMDTSPFKSIATSTITGTKSQISFLKGKGHTPVEDERAFVANKRQAVKDIFKNNEFIEHTFIKDEKPVIVREYKPLIFNFVFSAQANKASNVKAARRENIAPTLQLFSQLIEQNNLSGYPKNLFDKENRKAIVKQLVKDLQNSDLDPNLALALKAVLITLTGKAKDENGKRIDYDKADHCDTQFLLINHLTNQVKGKSVSVECKSGNDRTATSMALSCAQAEFEKSYLRPFDPTAKNQGDIDEFKKLFTKYIKEFAVPNLVASRGVEIGDKPRPIIKTGKSPPYQKWIDKTDLEVEEKLQYGKPKSAKGKETRKTQNNNTTTPENTKQPSNNDINSDLIQRQRRQQFQQELSQTLKAKGQG